MPRLFTGLEIPARLAGELSLLRGGLCGATWIDTENYHITLRFIGDIDRAMAADVAGMLDAIRHPAFPVTLDQLDTFGGDKPRAIIARARPASPLAVADYLAGRGLFATRQFEATRFVLYSSRDSVGGGPYRVEAEYPLG